VLDFKGIGWTQARDGQLAITPDHLPRPARAGRRRADDLSRWQHGRAVALTTKGKQLAVRLMGRQAAQMEAMLI